MPRILLTTTPSPFTLTGYPGNPLDLFSSRLSAGQGIFTFNYYSPPLGLHYIAQNIQSPATVMEYPTMKQLQRELSKGYDIVGISFSNSSKNDSLKACQMIRNYSPKTKIILGGYGVQCLDHSLESDSNPDGLFDEVCREEGIGFMRRYLGEPADRPFSSDLPPQVLYPFGAPFAARPVGCIIIAFGCENACPFCQTSAYYHHKQLVMLSPEEIAHQAKQYLRTYPAMTHLAFFCENFLGDRSYAEEIRNRMEEDPETRLDRFSIEIMSSVKNISSYDPEELASLGIGSVWIGVESKFTNLEKRKGITPEKIFPSLHAAGIQTTGSFIIGLDEQSTHNIEEDINYLISLEPTMIQVAALVPGPGAEIWDTIKNEDRLRLHDWKEQHAYSETIEFKNFPPGQVRYWIEKTIEKLFTTHGPGIFRSINVLCQGYERFRHVRDKRLRARGEHYKQQLLESRIVLPWIKKYAPTEMIKKKVGRIHNQVVSLLGPATVKDRLYEAGLGAWLAGRRIMGKALSGDHSHPRFRRTCYRVRH
ncbi:MAG: hypothetical protein JXJ04_03890 [Spirochaetales bacterium]|nr:hypothetical protein [Spirochaetales bacterium]